MKTVAIAIPLYNQEAEIPSLVSRLLTLEIPSHITISDIIFVDDGSVDKTFSRLLSCKTMLETEFTKRNMALTVHIVSYPIHAGRNQALSYAQATTDAPIIVLDRHDENSFDEMLYAQ